MANKPSKLSINVKAILKEHLNPSGEKTFLNCAIWPNKDGVGSRGDTHYITQEVSKEAREKGIRGAIIGNITWLDESEPQHQAPAKTYNVRSDKDRLNKPGTGIPEGEEGDEIPF